MPYKGSVYSVVRDLVEAIKARLGHAGARNVKGLWVKAVFMSSRRSERVGVHEALNE